MKQGALLAGALVAGAVGGALAVSLAGIGAPAGGRGGAGGPAPRYAGSTARANPGLSQMRQKQTSAIQNLAKNPGAVSTMAPR